MKKRVSSRDRNSGPCTVSRLSIYCSICKISVEKLASRNIDQPTTVRNPIRANKRKNRNRTCEASPIFLSALYDNETVNFSIFLILFFIVQRKCAPFGCDSLATNRKTLNCTEEKKLYWPIDRSMSACVAHHKNNNDEEKHSCRRKKCYSLSAAECMCFPTT